MPLQAFIGCYKKQNDKLLLVAIRVEDEESKRLANLKEKFEYLQKVIK